MVSVCTQEIGMHIHAYSMSIRRSRCMIMPLQLINVEVNKHIDSVVNRDDLTMMMDQCN